MAWGGPTGRTLRHREAVPVETGGKPREATEKEHRHQQRCPRDEEAGAEAALRRGPMAAPWAGVSGPPGKSRTCFLQTCFNADPGPLLPA